MSKEFTFIIIFFILTIFIYYNSKQIDTFVNDSTSEVDAQNLLDFNNNIKNKYLSDVEIIRKLYNMADKVNKDGIILSSENSTNKLSVDGDTNITNINTNNNINGDMILNGQTNINNLNIKGIGGIFKLETKSNTNQDCNIELYPKTKSEGRKGLIGFSNNKLNTLQIKNEDTGTIIIGNKNNPNAIVINNNGNININTDKINAIFPVYNIAYKRGLISKPDNMTIDTISILTSCEYTPKSSSSLIYITCSGNYKYNNNYNDTVFKSHIFINNTNVFSKLQSYYVIIGMKKNDRNQDEPVGGHGGETRSGTLFPISYLYNNNSKNKLKIEIKAEVIVGNDILNVNNDGFLLMITEYNPILL